MRTRHRAFERFLQSAAPLLAARHGEDFAEEVLAATRIEFEAVLPEVPDIGGLGNVFQPVMTVNGWIVALYRAMKARGKTAEDAIRICQHVFDGWFRMLPGFLLRAIGWAMLSTPARWYFESQARRSRKQNNPADFVWRVERDDTGGMSLVFDECAVNKWYEAQDVRELAPFCNFADVTYSRLMGMGVDATETIGLGCDHCALRYRRGRETVVPPRLAGIIADG